MRTSALASRLDLLVPAIHQALNRSLLPGQAVTFTVLPGMGAERLYAIGPAPVVEV